MSYIEFLENLNSTEVRTRLSALIDTLQKEYPNLELEMKWNQPMLLDHGTFIIGFSVAAKHISVAPEKTILDEFVTDIVNSGYQHTKMLFKIKHTDKIDYSLLTKIVGYSIDYKKDVDRFWL